MKKSRIIVPALGLLALTTAASVVGTVAWFTASRTATIKAGKFAVVDVSDNMSVTLAAGVGVSSVNNGDTKSVTIGSDNKLTDASFDHTDTTMPYVVTPDVPRKSILKTTALNDANLADELSRGTNVFSAYTWKMTFKVDFAASAIYDQGLFLDLSADSTYMHKVFSFSRTAADNAASLAEGKHKVTAEEAALEYYSTEECDTEHKETIAEDDLVDISAVHYLKAPASSGKGFRFAFIPTAIGGTGTGTSVAYAKVWADNEGAESDADDAAGYYIHGVQHKDAVGEVGDPGYEPEVPATTLAAGKTAYGTSTIKRSGNTSSQAFAAATAGSGKVHMKSGDNTAVPADNTVTADGALTSNSNFLGVFKCDAGKDVELEYTVVAWFEGTHPYVDSDQDTVLETITSSMHFGVSNLANA